MTSPTDSLDYSALTQPVTAADITAFKQAGKATKTSGKGTAVIVYAVLGTMAVGFCIVTILLAIANNGHNFLGGLIPVAILAVFVAIFAAASHFRTKKLARLYKFALANHLTMIHDMPNPTYAGMIFDEGHSRRINEAFVFTDGTEIGNYQYTTGSGKNQTTHSWSYARLKLTRRLPHMVLDAKKNNLFGKLSNLPDSFNKDQTLALEGDFNNYFTLFAPKQYERDALYVFTPDVMAAVVDAGQAYDMEVIDDSLMIYSQSHFKLDSEPQWRQLLGIIGKIGTELRDQSKRYADERVGDRTQNIVAEPGRRLKSGIGAFTIAIIVIVIIFQVLPLIFSS